MALRHAARHGTQIEAKKKADEKKKARASTTDADARVMKMANGGFNPAYNAQFATDTKTQVITGVDVTNNGGDRGEMGLRQMALQGEPMVIRK